VSVLEEHYLYRMHGKAVLPGGQVSLSPPQAQAAAGQAAGMLRAAPQVSLPPPLYVAAWERAQGPLVSPLPAGLGCILHHKAVGAAALLRGAVNLLLGPVQQAGQVRCNTLKIP
jgi:hypothetical protein